MTDARAVTSGDRTAAYNGQNSAADCERNNGLKRPEGLQQNSKSLIGRHNEIQALFSDLEKCNEGKLASTRMGTSSPWNWTPYFMTEKGTRTYLQTLYTSIVGSTANARHLVTEDMGNRTSYQPEGNALVRECFDHAKRWLRLARWFSRSEDIFNNQVLEPSKTPAKYLVSIRDSQDPSMNATAFVFARTSEYFDKTFGASMRILSAILPGLNSVLSLKCRSVDAGEIEGHGVELRGVQPIPFVNRIHPVQLSFDEWNDDFALGSLDFLKVSMSDLQMITSVAFENFCNIQSIQAGNRRLGLPCVITGRILSITSPYMWIGNAGGNTSIKLMITKFLVRQVGVVSALNFYKGKAVRVLVAKWHSLGAKEPPVPEAFRIEAAEEPDLISDDAVGYVRLRGKVDRTVLANRYSALNESTMPPCISFNHQEVQWTSQERSSNSVANEFLRYNDAIKQVRAKEGTPWPWSSRPSRIFDSSKLKATSIAVKISRSDDLWASILEVIRDRDFQGRLPRSLAQLKRDLARKGISSADDTVGWFRGVGILSRKNDEVILRDRGVEAAYLSVRRQLKETLKRISREVDFVNLIDLERKTQFPPSLILRGLEDLERDGIMSQVEIKGKGVRLLWGTQTAGFPREPLEARGMAWLENSILRILEKLREVSYGLGTLALADVLGRSNSPASSVSTLLLLDYARDGGLIEETAPGVWFYSWKNRIRDFLLSHPHNTYPVDVLAQRNGLPPLQLEAANKILTQLQEERLAVDVLKGNWGARLRDPDAEKSRTAALLRAFCKQFIMSKVRRGVSQDWILAETRFYLRSLIRGLPERPIDVGRFAQEVLLEMIRNRDVDL